MSAVHGPNGVAILDPSKPSLDGTWIIVGANGRRYLGLVLEGSATEVGMPVALLPAYEWMTSVLASSPPPGKGPQVPVPTGSAMFARPVEFFCDEQAHPFWIVAETLLFVVGTNARDMVASAVRDGERWRRAMAENSGIASVISLVPG